jgi:hypothetical protein
MSFRMSTHKSWATEVVEFREFHSPQAALRSTFNTPDAEVIDTWEVLVWYYSVTWAKPYLPSCLSSGTVGRDYHLPMMSGHQLVVLLGIEA